MTRFVFLKKWLLAGTVRRGEKCRLFWDRGFCGVGCIVLVYVQKKKSGLSCGAGNDGGILWKSLSLILNFG